MRWHKLFYGSSYDRGLDMLLKLWPKIKETYPDAELHVCYGWDLFDKGYANNPERMAWKDRINKLMEAPGITHHGRLSKNELAKVRQSCGVWAYPTYFGETCCITALDCQRDGVVPCVIAYAALKETVQSGVKVEGDIYDPETQDEYLKQLLALMGDKTQWMIEQVKAQAFAEQYSWDQIAKRWEACFA